MSKANCVNIYLKVIISAAMLLGFAHQAHSQSAEQNFQDVFITAGYATAFGAALGAASLSFSSNPEENLDNVAIGASLGFIGGSLLGAYLVFTPVLVDNENFESQPLADNMETGKFYIRPYLKDSRNLAGLEGAWTLASF